MSKIERRAKGRVLLKPNFRVGKLTSQQCVLLSWHKNIQKAFIDSVTKYLLLTYCVYIFF